MLRSSTLPKRLKLKTPSVFPYVGGPKRPGQPLHDFDITTCGYLNHAVWIEMSALFVVLLSKKKGNSSWKKEMTVASRV